MCCLLSVICPAFNHWNSGMCCLSSVWHSTIGTVVCVVCRLSGIQPLEQWYVLSVVCHLSGVQPVVCVVCRLSGIQPLEQWYVLLVVCLAFNHWNSGMCCLSSVRHSTIGTVVCVVGHLGSEIASILYCLILFFFIYTQWHTYNVSVLTK